METKRLTASEKEALLRMNVAYEILMNEPQVLKDRAAMVPYAKRDFAMIASRIKNLMGAIRDTIPKEQMSTYVNALRMSQYLVGAKRPGSAGSRDDRQFGMWIPYEVLNGLFDGCNDHCTMCNLDKGQRKGCALRKALDIIPNDVPRKTDGDCPYYTMI